MKYILNASQDIQDYIKENGANFDYKKANERYGVTLFHADDDWSCGEIHMDVVLRLLQAMRDSKLGTYNVDGHFILFEGREKAEQFVKSKHTDDPDFDDLSAEMAVEELAELGYVFDGSKFINVRSEYRLDPTIYLS